MEAKNAAGETMYSMFDIPVDVAASLLRDWVNMRSLRNFDSALCVHQERSQYLGIASSESFVCDRTPRTFCGVNEVLHLEWLTRRRIRTKLWAFKSEVPPTLMLDFVAATGGDHVHTLELYGIATETAGTFAIIFNCCKHIATVTIEGCTHWTGIAVASGQAQKSLRKLVVGNCGDVSPGTFCRTRLSGLRCLYLGGDYGVGIMTSLLNAAPCLHDLRLREAAVDDAGLLALRKHATQLQTLVLIECRKITSAGVAALTQRCVSLTSLTLASCPQLNDSALQGFGPNCRLLETVELDGSFTEASASVLATLHGNTLKNMSFQEMAIVNNAGMRAVAECCKALEELHLGSCRELSAEALLLLEVQLPRLRKLAITRCNTVTDQVLVALVANHPDLKLLNLYGSTGYTSVGVLTIMRGLKQLEQFSVKHPHSIFSDPVVGLWQDSMPDLDINYYETNLRRFDVLANW
jgi:hypothetical protein